ncbi:hypothetical protein PFNF135_02896 [Plasmodium falciparum NF135/5.C10]|nr:hypothetical protein PFNF135_02896 [Plasmodium falciparum NF135/5.C10]
MYNNQYNFVSFLFLNPYKNDKNKIKFVLQGINHKDEYDSSLIILLPVEENYVDKLYEEYLKKAGDNPQHNSVKNVLKNILNRYDVIDQKIFLNKVRQKSKKKK